MANDFEAVVAVQADVCSIDLYEDAEFLAKATGASLEKAESFVFLEDDYFDEIGLNVYPDEDGKIDMEKMQSPAPVVEAEKLFAYIMAHSDLTKEMCERFFEVEEDFLRSKGLVEELNEATKN